MPDAERELYELVRSGHAPDQDGALELPLAIGHSAEDVFSRLSRPYFVLAGTSWRPLGQWIGDRNTAALINAQFAGPALCNLCTMDDVARRTRTLAMRWNWIADPPGPRAPLQPAATRRRPRRPTPTLLVTMQVTPLDDLTSEPHLRHREIPVAWANAVGQFWRYRLGGLRIQEISPRPRPATEPTMP